MLNITPLRERHQWHWVVAVRHASERIRCESVVKELREFSVADSRFAERCDGGRPSTA